MDLQDRLNLTYLFIAHDLAVVGYMSNRIGIMYHGRFVELGTRDQIFENPLHPYTRMLLSAVPIPDRAAEKNRQRVAITENSSVFEQTAAGCSFSPRCTEATDACRDAVPVMEMKEPEHWIACWTS